MKWNNNICWCRVWAELNCTEWMRICGQREVGMCRVSRTINSLLLLFQYSNQGSSSKAKGLPKRHSFNTAFNLLLTMPCANNIDWRTVNAALSLLNRHWIRRRYCRRNGNLNWMRFVQEGLAIPIGISIIHLTDSYLHRLTITLSVSPCCECLLLLFRYFLAHLINFWHLVRFDGTKS